MNKEFDPRLEGYSTRAMRRVMLTATAFGAAIITTLALTGALTTPVAINDGPPAVMVRDTPRVLPVQYVEPVQAPDPIGELIQTREALPTSDDVREYNKRRRLLASLGYGEARGECRGKPKREADICLALPMFVALSREASGKFGKGLKDVVLARLQFSAWNNGDPNLRKIAMVAVLDDDPEWERALRVADLVLAGKIKDPTDGALFYHEKSIKPDWAKKMKIVRMVGSHILRMPQKDA